MMAPMRVGFGYDSHRLVAEGDERRPLILGGVVFAGERGLVAHSDGDVLIHAVIDALLGAAALGNIGSHFPDTDERWHNADSMRLLSAVIAELAAHGYRLGNLDVTVICERPKIGPRADEIRCRVVQAVNAAVPSAEFGIDESAISIKGKTNEKLDDVGAGLGIEAHAVVAIWTCKP